MIAMATVQRQLNVSPRDVFEDEPVFTPGLLSQIGAVLLQPAAFFRSLSQHRPTRRWLWVALLILLLLALGAVQQAEQSADSAGGGGPVAEMPMGPDSGPGGPFDGPFPAEGGGGPAPAQSGPVDSWTIAVKAASTQILQWALLALILAEISMLRGRAPRLGLNLQIVIWASVPLALMSLVQMLFIAAGGSIGQAGLSGLLESSAAFADWNIFLRSFVYGLASNVTLFWLWSLALIYIAARQTLNGKRAAVIAVIAAWIIVLSIGSGVQKYKTFAAEQPQVVEIVPEDSAPVDAPLESVSGPAETEDSVIVEPEVSER